MRNNIFAGLTVGIVALPLSMALAIAVGVPPQNGLYTAIVAGIIASIFGSNKVNISGPTAAFVVILIPIVQEFGLKGLLICGLLSGFILLLMGILKLGTLIELIPYPVTVGFTTGIAVVIATFQIKDFFGLQIENPNIPDYVAIYDINGPMFFGAAQIALKTLIDIKSDIKIVILNLENVPMIDMTGLVALKSIIENFEKNYKQLIIVGANERISNKFEKVGIKFNNLSLVKKDTIDTVLKNFNKIIHQ